MSKKRPYYALHQILTGQYTRGLEFYTVDGIEYKGPYHKLPNGQFFTGFVPHESSIELFHLDTKIASSTDYRKLTKIETGKYVDPVYVLPSPTDNMYNEGFFYRYFVQQRNNPNSTIIEIDKEQFDSCNRTNGPGINENIWKKFRIQWIIRGDGITVSDLNRNILYTANNSFPGIIKYLTNLIEFLR